MLCFQWKQLGPKNIMQSNHQNPLKVVHLWCGKLDVNIFVKYCLCCRKSLRISSAGKKDTTSGEIVNLMSVDAQRICDLVPYVNMLWSSPLQIVVAIYMLYQVLLASPPNNCNVFLFSKSAIFMPTKVMLEISSY